MLLVMRSATSMSLRLVLIETVFSATKSIDTTTATGRLVLHLFGALGDFECDLLCERTTAGLKAAATRGRRGGRPAVMTPASWLQLEP